MRNRRRISVVVSVAILAAFALGMALREGFSRDTIAAAELLIGLSFTEAKRDSMIEGLNDRRKNYEAIRKIDLPNNISPALTFNPIPIGFSFDKSKKPFRSSQIAAIKRPRNLEDVAFYSIGQLAHLLKTQQVTSEELTQMYLSRLKRYGPTLECVVTLTESLAVAQAKRADREIRAGKYRGPLHGIPYGAKDLLAVRGYPTTWGATPYKEQVIHEDATVVKKLEQAGAVLVAKLTLGALAWGDVWFGGTTRNPWNIKQGSSGSSAGSASATAAGLVAFAIGSETWGSIVSPSTRCGVTGLRPTYGRISRTGAMALSWSMDKLGPICRTVEDCAIVFNAIYGLDPSDQTLYDAPFNYSPTLNLAKLRFGFLKTEFDSARANKENNDAVLATLRRLGATISHSSSPQKPPPRLTISHAVEKTNFLSVKSRTHGQTCFGPRVSFPRWSTSRQIAFARFSSRKCRSSWIVSTCMSRHRLGEAIC
jgi:Asp-tRNA(Asn)/Glu-tRNA(Gln) amidotransferase A subunit family amidase